MLTGRNSGHQVLRAFRNFSTGNSMGAFEFARTPVDMSRSVGGDSGAICKIVCRVCMHPMNDELVCNDI